MIGAIPIFNLSPTGSGSYPPQSVPFESDKACAQQKEMHTPSDGVVIGRTIDNGDQHSHTQRMWD